MMEIEAFATRAKGKGKPMHEQYEIIAVRGHFEVYDSNGNFFCSADSYPEAQREIEIERNMINA